MEQSSVARPAHPSVDRVCILGASLDVGNRGVLALGVSLARLIRRSAPSARVAFHYPHQAGGLKQLRAEGEAPLDIEILNCRLSPKSAPSEHILVILALAALYRIGVRAPARRNPWLRSLIDADFIGDITGGDSFSDIYGFRRFFTGSLPLLSVVMLGRPFVMLPQTYGPFKLRASRILARFLVRRAAAVFTRDANCVPLVERLFGRTPQFCPDVAFTLEPARPPRLQTMPAGLDLDGSEPIIGLNVSGLLYMGGYTGRNMFGLRSEYRELIDELLEALLKSSPAKVLLVPHVFGPEREVEASSALLDAVAARHPGRVFMATEALTERELKWIIGRTSFFVGSRMHACIGALSQCVPAVGLAYSDKFLGVFESARVGETIIDLRGMDAAATIARTLEYLDRRETLHAVLKERIPLVQEEVRSSFREMLAAGADAATNR